MLVHWNALIMLALFMTTPRFSAAAAVGTGFTYQGQLSQSGAPLDGLVHLRFTLWDAPGTGEPPTGGNPVGVAQVCPGVPIAAGVFTVEVNGEGWFGAQAFNGEARWLQVEVCADSVCSASTVLGPRQPLTAAPYALGPLHSGIDGSGLFLEHRGESIAGSRLRLQTSRSGDQSNYVQLNIDPELGFSFMPIGVGNHNVGVGTQSPTERLDVRGSIKFGAAGEYFAPGSPEKVRMLRGKVSAAGVVIDGVGFTASRVSTGVYSVAFSPTFATGTRPVVTASAESNGPAKFEMVNSPIFTSTRILVVNGSGTPLDCDFYFIAIGAR